MVIQELFLFKDTLYKQIYDVAMGCPLRPTLTNFFMAHMENPLLCNDPESSPKLYLRYIDDIFAIFDDDQSCTKFLEKLNTQHPNIKFTLEQAKSTMPFLNVEIKLTSINLIPGHGENLLTPDYFKFQCFCPKIWKKDLIFCLLNRAKLSIQRTICSKKKLLIWKIFFTATAIQFLFSTKFYTNFKTKNQTIKPEKNLLTFLSFFASEKSQKNSAFKFNH